MKKILAMVLAMLLLTVPTLADVDPYAWNEIEYEPSFEGAEVNLEALSMNITLPVDWLIMEVPEEQLASGMLYHFATEDGLFAMTITYTENEEAPMTYESLLDEAVAAEYEATLVSINSIPYMFAALDANTIMAMVLLDETTVVTFAFNYTGEDSEVAGDYAMGVLGSWYFAVAE